MTGPVNADLYSDVKIAIIGGSGLYHLDNLKVLGEINPETPWGHPSDKIIISETPDGHKIAFLARHGRGHFLNPSEVPARANIAALKHIGVEVILAFSAVGSLREEIKPRDFVLPSQIVDRTKGIRPSTYFENGVTAHVGFADPFDKELSDIIFAQGNVCEGVTFHTNKTLVCMEGPAFSTRAESHMYRSWGCDIINMSVLPEAKLAREAEIGYQMVCMSTDYDCWKETEEAVSVEAVIANLGANSDNAKKLLLAVIPAVTKALDAGELKSVAALQGANKYAVITSKEKRNAEQLKKLEYLLPGYFI
ncbi:methylthioadenosine phosphorylase [Spizellomyces punctatus DAOM BR117]|uniref:S-methyl-5'-thioadenosine phosphorylase n=1 Tax=Spizellomyces punctatus (strain DAOM BR117) TaxID=645134 RepID=A0A0L0H8H2_SPIPD|nr:methylthioadenosine phosphorylase [Spizellomyces punctatus DAOM BR117]KNC96983.1 methylthioadenosine phosphorylase [Spizellomyces punctatus DAOM BR117]|eukprot:XP_016605023.1 methylthioadenosine phosphorylase [Spizellomyces punctatus DAOM BR117]